MENDSSSLFMYGSAASTFCLLATYYFYSVAQKPKVYSSNIRMLNFLEKYVKTLDEIFYPAWYCWEGRIQSIMGLALRSDSDSMDYKREILDLPDGGILGLDFLEPKQTESAEKKKLIVLILPGMTSSSETSYVKTIALSIVNVGATVCIFNQRGLGDVPLKTPRTYCATKTDDMEAVICHLQNKFPNEKIFAIGTSLGGMILCNYLKMYPDKQNFVAALVISICWDPLIGTESLERPFLNKYVVNYGITQNLRDLVIKYKDVLQTHRKCLDFDKIIESKTIREFDTTFTAPQFGYENVTEYYQSAKLVDEMHKFSIPVFAIQANDDPMHPGEYLPIKEVENEGTKNVALIVTEKGGHLGFIDSYLPRRQANYFLERIIADLVTAVRLHSDELTTQ